MKKNSIACFLIAASMVALPVYAASTASKAAVPPKAEVSTPSKKGELTAKEDILSYLIGYQVGGGIKSQPFKVKENLFFQGIKDASSGKQSMVTQEKAQEVVHSYKQELMAKHEAEMKVLATANSTKAIAFLEGNKKKPGIVVLPSGLQYQVLTEGKGQSPKPTDTVTTHYRGTLVDGTEFDSSYARNVPMTIPVNGVIPGWTEALQKMKVGSKWKLFVPPKLAYGDKGQGNAIPPNALLIFEVELLGVGEQAKKQGT